MTYVVVGCVYTLLMFLALILILVAAKAEVVNSGLRLIIVLGIFLITPVRQALYMLATRVTVTLDEISFVSGKGKKQQKFELFLSQVERVHVEQGLLQRLSGCGTIYIKRFDEIQRLTLEHMEDPYKLADLIVTRARA